MDRIEITRQFSPNTKQLIHQLEAMYNGISERLNYLLDKVIEEAVTTGTTPNISESGIEIPVPGNEAGDDGNWFITANMDGDLVVYRKESGTWVNRGFLVSAS